MSMNVSDFRTQLLAIEAWAGELRRSGSPAQSPAVKEALDLYEASMKGEIRKMLDRIDAAPAGQIDTANLVKQLDGKIDAFLKVAARCPAMQVFQQAAAKP